jgi:hypothetical protein
MIDSTMSATYTKRRILMANLTETSYYARRAINWLILGVFAYIILRIIWSIFVALIIIMFPPKAPPPNHAFGVLPKIIFPPQASPSASTIFRLETIEGNVPKASESAYVYFMPKQAANLLALPRTQKFADKLLFNPKEIQETKNIYRFTDPEFPLRSLRYDIISNNFTLQYAYGYDQAIFSNGNTLTTDVAINEAINFLQNNGIMPSDFSRSDFTASYLTLVGDRLVKTPSITQANATKVNTKRTSIGGSSIYYPDPDESPLSFVFSGSSIDKKRILSVTYTYWPVEYQTNATYSIKKSQIAWQELQSGKGYIARYPLQGETITVRSVHLGYYDSLSPQTYLQPIFVFEGDDGFLGFVPAVASPWTE